MIEKVSDFKERFNKAISIRNIKPVELSEKTGISESTISQYRSGYAKPKEEKLALLANALNVDPTWLMGLNVPMDEEERAKSIIQDYVDNGSDLRHTDTVEVISEADKLLLYRLHKVRPSTLDSINLLIEADLRKP